MKNLRKLLIIIALQISAFFFSSILKKVFDVSIPSILGSGFIVQMFLLATSLIYLFKEQISFSDFGFKLTKLKYFFYSILFGTLEGILSIIIMIIFVLTSGATETTPHPATKQGFLYLVFNVWIIASLCEEIFFRGFVYKAFSNLKDKGFHLSKKIFVSIPVTISAILFGLGHLCLLRMMITPMVFGIVITATILGFIAGILREKSGSIIPAYFAHLMANVMGFVIPFILNKFDL